MRKIILWAVLVLLVLGIAGYFIYAQTQVKFDGSRISKTDPAGFYLRFSVMNTKDTETLSLHEGDALRVSWLIESGSVDVLIAMKGEAPLYQANGRGNGDDAVFDLTVPKSGDYTVTVTGKNAKGWMRFEEKK